MISPQDALDRVLAMTQPLASASLPLRQAYGLILAEPIVPRDPSPPFDNSAKDGYAVLATDTIGASPENPVRLRVLETIPAGKRPEKTIKPGTASRIMTGAPTPNGADAIVMVEYTRFENDHVLIQMQVPSGNEIRLAGEDLTPGVTALEPGRALNSARVALAAAAGYEGLLVHPRPKVGVLVTGDELVEPGQPLSPGKIRNSNLFSLYGQILEAGGEPVEFKAVGDDKEALAAAIAEALIQCDILVSSGGVSVGDFDYVTEAAQEAGARIHFTKISQRPGKPMVFGSIANKLFFGLPGNPVSVMVCFEVYVRPAIRKMLGRKNLQRPAITGTFNEPYSKVKELHFWTRVIVTKKDGGYLLTPSAGQRSDILSSMALGNGLAELPAGIDSVPIDMPVQVRIFDDPESRS
jgi:molybdopterin molybdotransferase